MDKIGIWLIVICCMLRCCDGDVNVFNETFSPSICAFDEALTALSCSYVWKLDKGQNGNHFQLRDEAIRIGSGESERGMGINVSIPRSENLTVAAVINSREDNRNDDLSGCIIRINGIDLIPYKRAPAKSITSVPSEFEVVEIKLHNSKKDGNCFYENIQLSVSLLDIAKPIDEPVPPSPNASPDNDPQILSLILTCIPFALSFAIFAIWVYKRLRNRDDNDGDESVIHVGPQNEVAPMQRTLTNEEVFQALEPSNEYKRNERVTTVDDNVQPTTSYLNDIKRRAVKSIFRPSSMYLSKHISRADSRKVDEEKNEDEFETPAETIDNEI